MSAFLKIPFSALFKNPLEWSRLYVGTLQRFWVNAVSLTLMQLLIVYEAATGKWMVAIIMVVAICWFQFRFIYALRLLVLRANAASHPKNVA